MKNMGLCLYVSFNVVLKTIQVSTFEKAKSPKTLYSNDVSRYDVIKSMKKKQILCPIIEPELLHTLNKVGVSRNLSEHMTAVHIGG